MVDEQTTSQVGPGRVGEEALDRQVRELSFRLDLLNEDMEALHYSVSHDLRAPLRSIEGFAQVLLEEYEPVLDPTGQDYLQRVAAAARRMSAMIDGLLQLSRLSRGEMHWERVDLTRIARGIATRLSSVGAAREVAFDIQDGVWADGDHDLLLVVVENLLSNAWKFTSRCPRAHIDLGTRDQDGATVYFVRDDGAGFETAYAGKLFAPFQRMHPAAEFEGLGMGLALVRCAVHRHGGRVWAQAAVDRGATVFFTLQPLGGAW